MPILLGIQDDVDKVMRDMTHTGRRAVYKAAASGLNRAGNSARGLGIKLMIKRAGKGASGTGINAKLKQLVKVTRRANDSDPRYIYKVYSTLDKGLNIAEWMSRPQLRRGFFSRGSKRLPTTKAWGRTKTMKDVFIAPGKNSGKMLAWTRDKGAARGKLHFVFGPSARMLTISKDILPKIMAKAAERWPIEFENALVRFVGFRKKRAALGGMGVAR